MNDPRFDLGPWPPLGYVGGALDRAAERRGDAAFIAAAEQHRNAGVYAISGEVIVLARRGETLDPLLSPGEAQSLGPSRERVFIGVASDGAARSGLALAHDTAEALKARGDLLILDLRSIAIQGLAPDHLPALAAAKALLTWHATHRFCAKCGAETKNTEAGWRRDCPACGTHHFPRTDPCVIMLAIDGERCLVGRQSRFPPGMWSCLAGFVEPGETFEEAVRREMFEEAGIRTGRVSYYASQPWPFPMSVMIGFHAEATTTDLNIDRNELEGARWVGREEIAAMLSRRHPDRIFAPPPVAIAHHLIRAFVEKGAGVFG
ncbi:MAG TPA: NAD(+) diphosphatase [Xanthobacteraceae bacterium]|nr:NAD(+) diphosphatase [Xanthobacteraceae bacterium]